jgi:hypothetical protein
MNKLTHKPEPGSPLGLSFTDIYNGLCQRGWPMDIAWREALARVQWLEDNEQTNRQETKQGETNT